MSSLQDSLKVKAAGTKAPAVTGQQRLKTPDVTSPEGQSGGITRSKAVKNAGSTSTGNLTSPASDFVKRTFNINPLKNKTNEYF